ncbi:MAG TPA: cytochrome c [Taishania sp.]|nr:cytochrome c [Taishania sp.]
MTRLFKYVFVIGFVANVFSSMAQNGEELFKNCFTCHTLGKKSTGPDLVGVRQKWVDAGEGDLLVDWVKDANAVITGGKSKMANEIKDFSPLVMPPVKLTTEEVNAIFDYIDSYKPAAPAAPAATASADATNPAAATAAPVEYKANYETNLVLFYLLIGLAAIALVSIAMMAGSISTLTDSTYFKERVNKLLNGGGKTLTIALLMGMLLSGNSAMAMSFGDSASNQPWLLVENSDIYLILFINIVLIGVVLYQRRLFSNIIGLVNNKKEVNASSEEESH